MMVFPFVFVSHKKDHRHLSPIFFLQSFIRRVISGYYRFTPMYILCKHMAGCSCQVFLLCYMSHCQYVAKFCAPQFRFECLRGIHTSVHSLLTYLIIINFNSEIYTCEILLIIIVVVYHVSSIIIIYL